MATRAFLTQHGDGAGDRAGEPQQDMNAHHGQKDWISGWYLNSRNVGYLVEHTDAPHTSSIFTHRSRLIKADLAAQPTVRQPSPSFTQSHLPTVTAAAIPANCATMNAATPEGAIPAKVSDNERAIVTAGLAKDVYAVNQ
jgi:hypothetical protein